MTTMGNLSLTLLFVFSLPQLPAEDRRQDDAHIVSEVLTYTVRREVDKLMARPDGWSGSPLVVLLDRTIPMCPDKTGPWEECVEASRLPAVRESWWTAALSVEFTNRNARPLSAPRLELPNVISIPYENTAGRRPYELYPNAAGWLAVSLPAYLDSGQALIYADFACGAMCCRQWFILVERSGIGWRVKREVGIGIC
jgi:hypothetical protein